MSISFSEATNNTGIVQQARSLMRVDSTMYPTYKIVNSSNHWSDFVTGYAIGADKRFAWDNTNHSKLPIGVTDIVENQTDYSFLVDEQGNSIITLTGISLVDANGIEQPLDLVDRNDPSYNKETYGTHSGTPTAYDKIADNIVKLDNKPTATDASTYDLKFYFQRTSPKFTATDTTITTGFSPLLDRGFVIASAYDGALTLGLPNLQALGAERTVEEGKVEQYFQNRNNDERRSINYKPIEFE